MYFSRPLVTDLVVHLRESAQPEPDHVRNLMYHLSLASDDIPNFVASLLTELRLLEDQHAVFPRRLAFAVVYDSLEHLSQTERFAHQAKLCRQVQKIDLGLQRLNSSFRLLDTFDDRLSLLFLAISSVTDLAHETRMLSNAELSAFVERILEAWLRERELYSLLLDRLNGQLRYESKTRLRLRVRDTVREALLQLPYAEQGENAVHLLDGPIRLGESLVTMDAFHERAKEMVERFQTVFR